MYSGTRSFIVIAFTFLACLAPGVHSSEAQQIRIESFFPRQLPLGQATVVNVAVPNRGAIPAPAISPSPRGRGAGTKLGQKNQRGLPWAGLPNDVAKEPAPGDPILGLLFAMGRP